MNIGIDPTLGNRVLAWSVLLMLALLAGVAVFQLIEDHNEHTRLQSLTADATRLAATLAPDQLQGKLQVALTQLGASDPLLKEDARGQTPLNAPDTLAVLASVGQRFGVPGVFVVGADGMIRSSWNENGDHSSGLNVAFRPYFSAAMAGHARLYAGISIARQDHSLYFAVPITDGLNPLSPTIGVLVARSDVTHLTRLLAQAAPRRSVAGN